MKTVLNLCLAVLLVGIFPVMGQWKIFVDHVGEMPIDYTNPANDIKLKTEWFAKARPMLDQYSSLVLIELNCRGFLVENVKISREYNKSPWGWDFSGLIGRAGLFIEFLIDHNAPFKWSPAQFVDEFEQKWKITRNDVLTRPWEFPPNTKGIKIKSFRDLFFYTPEEKKCEAIYNVGNVCIFDSGQSSVGVKILP